nr:uncharacterized protein LOC4352598 isoform X1 [Oryza sativa Japonica Group]
MEAETSRRRRRWLTPAAGRRDRLPPQLLRLRATTGRTPTTAARSATRRRRKTKTKARRIKKGMACLPLTSPARGICITSRALFEFQLCIRTEDSPEAEDEPKGGTLIEGCTEFTNILRSTSFTETVRLYGEKCGLGVKFLLLVNAVQATVDVEIIHSRACGLNLKLYAKTSGFSDVLRLFRGVAQSSRKISSVVAVVRRSHLDLCIEGSPADIDLGEKLPCTRWEHRFGAGFHGTVEEVVKLGDFTTISVKVTWKAVSKLPP